MTCWLLLMMSWRGGPLEPLFGIIEIMSGNGYDYVREGLSAGENSEGDCQNRETETTPECCDFKSRRFKVDTIPLCHRGNTKKIRKQKKDRTGDLNHRTSDPPRQGVAYIL
ncbi:hypothetical protein Pelo_4692 [Pelomyxa schiedti]|nr:hypothetical protein Pelo_4692 [Pelomyxa schiedti]